MESTLLVISAKSVTFMTLMSEKDNFTVISAESAAKEVEKTFFTATSVMLASQTKSARTTSMSQRLLNKIAQSVWRTCSRALNPACSSSAVTPCTVRASKI